MPGKHSPQRTCLGCRKTGEQRDMLRMVCSPEDKVVADIHHKLPGRGIYVCYDPDCFKKVAGRGVLSRGFRKSIHEPDMASLAEDVSALMFGQLISHLSLLRKSGLVDVGFSKVYESLKPQGYDLVVIAKDVSQPRIDKLRSKASTCGVSCLLFASKALIGQAVGRDESSTLGLKTGGLTKKFMGMVEQYRQLAGEF